MYVDRRFQSSLPQLWNELRPNRLMFYGIESARGYDPIILNTYTRFVNRLYGLPPESPQGGLLFFPPPDRAFPDGLNLANVRYIVTTYPLSIPYRLLFEEKQSPIKVYENPSARPRFFWVKSSDATTVEVISSEPARVCLQVRCPETDRLVWSQVIYPGWRVLVDGELKSLRPYAETFLSVDIPPGEHRIIFAFFPRSFAIGVVVSLLTLLVWGTTITCGWKKKE